MLCLLACGVGLFLFCYWFIGVGPRSQEELHHVCSSHVAFLRRRENQPQRDGRSDARCWLQHVRIDFGYVRRKFDKPMRLRADEAGNFLDQLAFIAYVDV